ncbi:unnamed protein product [Lepeophtheirus salmonis]|uniref:(salmon louse) hypothetical protein n=1 Tax=Lepeophtheirus salmonis TaxID=72036 RepID=A0A7R8D3T2_LEPSM|nr:unnamed protein product [Lepeophtheirus salmonis]CAF2986506.1 unnamed protein product [Lepeophtheirus salmonis]
MSSSRTSIRLKKKKSGVPSLDLAGPIPAETIDDIVATSGNSVEEFIGTFHGLGTKHLESFFKNLNKSQTLECWKNWSKLTKKSFHRSIPLSKLSILSSLLINIRIR